MSNSRNCLIGLALAVSFLFVANVKADTVVSTETYEYKITTADSAKLWHVATLLKQGNSGYTNPVNSNLGSTDPNKTTANGIYTSVGTKWSDLNAADYLKNASYGAVKQGSRSQWTDSGKWVGIGDKDNKIENGFYAFKYSLFTTNGETLTSGSLNLGSVGSDDYITAVYANGERIYLSELVQDAKASDSNWTTLSKLLFEDVALDYRNGIGYLDLVFVVHNTNLGGTAVNSNPMGLFVDGWLTTSILMYGPDDKPGEVVTPEPATLAVFGLGLAGLGLARRRMKK